ncbi:protein FAM98B-like [Populus alba x Populus x berolinensis]|uniref:Protein FAM98B-like n=1 Tax=Populus alba x Populus x berolinensis TaxID=444605 RepID=A0AAD6RDU4_9ROSI|nr:protein FAM98B-like [Populus alba x Populus x berolinensis]
MASNHCRNEQLSVPIRGGWWVEILGHLDGEFKSRVGKIKPYLFQEKRSYGSDDGYGPGSGGGGYGNANGIAVGQGGGVGWGGVGGDGHFRGGFHWPGNGGGMARVMVAA